MQSTVITSCYIRRCANWLRWVLGAAVLGILIFQMAVPPRLAALELSTTYQEFEEDSEPTEETETDGEQFLFELSGPQSVRTRQPGTRLTKRYLTNANSPFRSASCSASPSIAAELIGRNGIGGPLRC